MLFKYKNDYEKIAMGYLSFIPDFQKVSHVQAELANYINNEHQVLLLWQNDQDNFDGLVGIEKGDDFILVKYISLDPSFRNNDNTFKILDELVLMYPDKRVLSSIMTAPIIAKWEQHHSK